MPCAQMICYNAALSALERAERGSDAIKLLRQMSDDGVRPNEVSYSTAISACAKVSPHPPLLIPSLGCRLRLTIP